ncbi:RagB/SusD family nutrient uptake outer membrane protein [Chitinophaga oryzae]|uniref:RagB/SusD family nutrient uptake outer membrane protein n=1 Tax=Chitinophaga oryzae TaxID=2725414 RepID=UPI001C6620E2|nr:RagB/SusD family nutrient uptake outer membrane protein [Chitinophaga oryzae]
MTIRYELRYTIYLLLCLMLAAGCNKELTESPRGLVAGDDALTSQAGLETVLTGAYGTMMVPWTSGFTTVSQIAMTMGSDDLTTHPGSNKEEFREFDLFTVSSLNSRMNPIWLGCYRTIQSTTNIISNYDKVLDGNKDTVHAIVGEASYLRALSYYWLTRLWGEVPILPSAKYIPEYLNLKKSKPAEIYQLIEEDLKRAEEWVPNGKRSSGRMNKGAVKALLADVYLTEAGWPLKNQAKYAQAAAKAKEVIDNKALYGFDLYTGDYLKIFAGGTVEDVFTLFTRGSWITYNSFYGLSTMPEDEGGWSDFFPELNFFNNFPAGPRKDATFSTEFKKKDGTTIPWQETTTHHPYYKKFTIQSGQKDVYMSNNPVIMMRYAHVLLIYAEAQARSAGAPNSDAYTAANAVRQRAGLPELPGGMTGAAFATAVVNERAWEFAGEWNRWFDLVRLELVEAANANKAEGDLQPVGTVITKAKYWMPVPGADAAVNPNL